MIEAKIQTELLQHYPMLGELPASQLDGLLVGAASLQLPAGSVVFDENQACKGFPLLLSGSVRVIKSAPNGRELQLYRVGPGESCILTSSCLLGRDHYHARGIVEQDAELVLLPASAFRQLVALLAGKPSPIRSTHQALADELGSVREIVSRLLKNFAEQGWVKLGREQIEITDASALQRYAEL